MTEKELILKIQELRQIGHEEGWVLATKSQILGEPSPSFSVQALMSSLFVQRRLAFASLLIFLVLVGTLGFAQNSLPGDLLFPLKKMTERSQQVFVSEAQRPKVQLEVAQKRLEELTRIAQDNKVKKLASAIEEVEASVSEAAQGLAKAKEKDLQEIVQEAKKIEEKKEKVEALGVVVETEELDNTLAEIVKREIEDLEAKSLTERQEEGLVKVKEDFEKGNYSEALEKILILSQ